MDKHFSEMTVLIVDDDENGISNDTLELNLQDIEFSVTEVTGQG